MHSHVNTDAVVCALPRAGYRPAWVYPIMLDDHDWQRAAVPGESILYLRCANCKVWQVLSYRDPCPSLPQSRRSL